MASEFRNEPVTDFSRDESARRAQQAAIDSFKPVDCPVVVNGERVRTPATFFSVNPCSPKEVVGRASKAGPALADRAIRGAHEAFDGWSKTPPERRAHVLLQAASILRQRRWEMNATLILEVGKTWAEADADTAEAIDFCTFYGREMVRIASENPVTKVPGEKNRLVYLPLGVGVVISPWNFPCAILCGMAGAALVAGNAVVMKPASAAPAVGFKTFEILEAAGAPPGALQFLPTSGAEVGDFLVDHPLTRFVSFTGSKDVGVRIYERAAKLQPGQRWLKRAVVEMGGKDAIVVDEDADLEAAAEGIVRSAFGYQGQKCSACSRAIAVGRVYDKVLDLVKRRTEALQVGEARRPDTELAAVVSDAQLKKVLEYIEVGKREGRLVTGGGRAPYDGWFVRPTIFADVRPDARLAQEEIFGPVLAFLRAQDYEDAIRIANGTDYGLTGAYYGKKRAERAKQEFHVGNLYINRRCTGALVGGHPFGGFNMSGTDSKAGGRDYLLNFLQAKTVSEKA